MLMMVSINQLIPDENRALITIQLRNREVLCSVFGPESDTFTGIFSGVFKVSPGKFWDSSFCMSQPILTSKKTQPTTTTKINYLLVFKKTINV